jgi:putative transposase
MGILSPLLPSRSDTLRGRPEENSRRSIVDGILYILHTGGAWRMMPNDLPHWKTCYHYFRLWSRWRYWKKIHDTLRDLARKALEKKAPTAAVIDSPRVRTACQPGPRGHDAAKKINGRKRYVPVDTFGFPLALRVAIAAVHGLDGDRMLPAVLMLAFRWAKISGLTALTEALYRMRSGAFPGTAKLNCES